MNFPDNLAAGIFDSMKIRAFISILFFDFQAILQKLLFLPVPLLTYASGARYR